MKNTITYDQGGDYSLNKEERWMDGIKFILNLLTEKKDLRKIKILDVGCGDGSFYRFLKSEAEKSKINSNLIEYLGLDSNRLYQKNIKKLSGKFICCDILKLSKIIKKEKYDVVIASEIIEHIDETDRFIEEIKKVTKKGGYIYLTTPNLAAWHCRLMLLFGFQPLPTEVSNISSTFGKGIIGKKYYSGNPLHHIRIFTYNALKEFLRYHKLNIIKVYGGGYRKIDKILYKNIFIGLSPIIIVILKKN